MYGISPIYTDTTVPNYPLKIFKLSAVIFYVFATFYVYIVYNSFISANTSYKVYGHQEMRLFQ